MTTLTKKFNILDKIIQEHDKNLNIEYHSNIDRKRIKLTK